MKFMSVRDRANQLIQAHLATLPVVYGHNEATIPAYWGPHENNIYNDTHTARLWNPTKLEGGE